MKKIDVLRTVSAGITMGKVFLVQNISLEPDNYAVEGASLELDKFKDAVEQASIELERLLKENDIFAAHLEVVNDKTLQDGIQCKVEEEHQNIQLALWNTAQEFITIFEEMEDEYMRERAADIKDVRNRLMSLLKNQKRNPFAVIKEPVIIVAQELTPSDTAMLDLNYVLGFITQDGGVTSHVSIMAKNIGLPALVGVADILSVVKEDDYVVMDAGAGEIMVNPTQAVIAMYTEKKDAQEHQQSLYEETSELAACTVDGHEVQVCVNVGSLDEIKNAVAKGQKAVGLFRSEFLYMENTHFPTEEEQFVVYKEAATLCKEELTIRTLDIGGDKELSYYEFEKEENPFLGFRAIRICLEMKDMFKTQLRAILRASAYGNVRIMFPMIISMEELMEAKALLEECKQELKAEKMQWNDNMAVGMMIETPASVILADAFAKEVDFFSIGTNDLTQYILAVDRGNTKIASRYDSFHPAVKASIQMVIDAGHRAGITVGMCGEMASNEDAVEMLLRMGLDEFSVATSCAAKVKYCIRNITWNETKKIF